MNIQRSTQFAHIWSSPLDNLKPERGSGAAAPVHQLFHLRVDATENSLILDDSKFLFHRIYQLHKSNLNPPTPTAPPAATYHTQLTQILRLYSNILLDQNFFLGKSVAFWNLATDTLLTRDFILGYQNEYYCTSFLSYLATKIFAYASAKQLRVMFSGIQEYSHGVTMNALTGGIVPSEASEKTVESSPLSSIRQKMVSSYLAIPSLHQFLEVVALIGLHARRTPPSINTSSSNSLPLTSNLHLSFSFAPKETLLNPETSPSSSLQGPPANTTCLEISLFDVSKSSEIFSDPAKIATSADPPKNLLVCAHANQSAEMSPHPLLALVKEIQKSARSPLVHISSIPPTSPKTRLTRSPSLLRKVDQNRVKELESQLVTAKNEILELNKEKERLLEETKRLKSIIRGNQHDPQKLYPLLRPSSPPKEAPSSLQFKGLSFAKANIVGDNPSRKMHSSFDQVPSKLLFEAQDKLSHSNPIQHVYSSPLHLEESSANTTGSEKGAPEKESASEKEMKFNNNNNMVRPASPLGRNSLTISEMEVLLRLRQLVEEQQQALTEQDRQLRESAKSEVPSTPRSAPAQFFLSCCQKLNELLTDVNSASKLFLFQTRYHPNQDEMAIWNPKIQAHLMELCREINLGSENVDLDSNFQLLFQVYHQLSNTLLILMTRF